MNRIKTDGGSLPTGERWNCPHCNWVGHEVPQHYGWLEVYCPECAAIIEDEHRRNLEDRTGLDLEEIHKDDGDLNCPVCGWSFSEDDLIPPSNRVGTFTNHIRNEHSHLLQDEHND